LPFLYVHVMHFDHVYPLHYSSLFFLMPLLKFHYFIFIHAHNVLWSYSTHSKLSFSPSSPPWFFLQTVLIFYLYLLFRSRFGIWEKACDICVCVRLISLNMMVSSSIHFSADDIILFFLVVEYSVGIYTTFSYPFYKLMMISWFHGLDLRE
jgi:hypothetical protein